MGKLAGLVLVLVLALVVLFGLVWFLSEAGFWDRHRCGVFLAGRSALRLLRLEVLGVCRLHVLRICLGKKGRV